MGKYREDWDGAWKHVLEHHLKELLEFGFPEIHDSIDWSVEKEILNTELLPESHHGKGYRSHVDCLVRLVLKETGQSIILHFEVQGRKELGFSCRAFDYNQDLTRYYGEIVITLLILADADPQWRPNRYERESFGQRITFSVPCLKVLDYGEEELSQSTHPAAFLLLGAQKALATRRGKNRFERRLQYKQELTSRLLSGLYPAIEITGLFRSLDWLLALPEHYELQFREWKSSLFNQSSTPTMKLYTLESLARKEGRQIGQIALLQRMLTQHFGVLPDWARDKLESANSQQLEAWADRIFTAKSLEDLLG